MLNITLCKEINGEDKKRIKTIHIDPKVPFNKLIQFLIAVSGYKEEDIFSVSLYMDFEQHDHHLQQINRDNFSRISDKSFDQVLRENIRAWNVILSLFCTISVAEDVQPVLVWPCPQKVLVVRPVQMNSVDWHVFVAEEKVGVFAEKITVAVKQKHFLLPPQLSSTEEAQTVQSISHSPVLPLSLGSSLSSVSQNRSTRWQLAGQRINELLLAYNNQYYFDVIACINLNKQRYEYDIQILKAEKVATDQIDDVVEFVEHVLFKMAAAYLKLRNKFWFEYCVAGKYWGAQLNYLAMCLIPAGAMFSPAEVNETDINELQISGNPSLGYISKNVAVLAFILRRARELIFDIDTLDGEFLNALCAARENCGDSYRVTKINFKGACSVEQLKRFLVFFSRINLFSKSRLINMDIAVYPIANKKITENANYHLMVRENHRCEERFITVHGDIDITSQLALMDALPKSDKTKWDVKVIVETRTLSLAASGSSSQNVLSPINHYFLPTKCTRLFIEELPLIQIDVNSQQRLSAADNVTDQSAIIVSVSLRDPENKIHSKQLPLRSDLIVHALNRLDMIEVAALHLHDITVSENDFPELMKFMTTRHDLYVDIDRVNCFVCHARTNVANQICNFSSNDMSIPNTPSEISIEIGNNHFHQDFFVNEYLSRAILALPEGLEKRIYISNKQYELYPNFFDLMLRTNLVSLFIHARSRPGALRAFLQALQNNYTLVELEINRGSLSLPEKTQQILARNKRLANSAIIAKALPTMITAVERILLDNNPEIIASEHTDILLRVIRLIEMYVECFSNFTCSKHERLEKVKHSLRLSSKSVDIALHRCIVLAKQRIELFSGNLNNLFWCLKSLKMHNASVIDARDVLIEQFIQTSKPTEPMPIREARQTEIFSEIYDKNAMPTSWIILGSVLYFICTPSVNKDNIKTALDIAESVLKIDAQKGMYMLKNCAIKYTNHFIILGNDNFIRPGHCVQSYYRVHRLMYDLMCKSSLENISPESVRIMLKMIVTLLRFHFLPIVGGEYAGSLTEMGFGNRMNPEALKTRLDNAQENPTQLLNVISDIFKFNSSFPGFENPAYFKALEELQKSLLYVQTITQSQGWVFGFVTTAAATHAENKTESDSQRNAESASASETQRKTISDVATASQASKGKQHATDNAENQQIAAQVPTKDSYLEDKKIYTEISSSVRLGGPTLFSISAIFYSDLLTPHIQKERQMRMGKERHADNAVIELPSQSWFGNDNGIEKNFEIAARKLARKPS